jgi:hypothetical protein
VPAVVVPENLRNDKGAIMTIITVTLPFPSSALSPNGGHKTWTKTQAVKPARMLAKCELLNIINGFDGSNPFYKIYKTSAPLSIFMEFNPPTKRHYDVDGMITRCKAYQDGLFEALGIDDNRIEQVSGRRREVVKGGKVTITIDYLESK